MMTLLEALRKSKQEERKREKRVRDLQSQLNTVKRARIQELCVEPLGTESMGALDQYLKVGEVLAKEPVVVDLVNAVQGIGKEHSFVLLDGPSGVGKTQTALAFCTVRKSLYFLLTLGQNMQAVYRPFVSQSGILCNVAQTDRLVLENDQKSDFSLHALDESVRLRTLGFLDKLWGELAPAAASTPAWPLSQASFEMQFAPTEMSIATFRKKHPDFCIVLDETPFLGNSKSKALEVQFIRNVLRLAGRVVMLGTNSTGSNIVATNSRADASDIWCTVFTIFPHPTIESLRVRHPNVESLVSDCALGAFTKKVIDSNRPWLVDMYLSYLDRALESPGSEPSKTLQQVVDALAKDLVAYKALSPEDWLRGQARLQLPAYRVLDQNLSNTLTHSHMAYLKSSETRVELFCGTAGVEEMLATGERALFKPQAYFPTAKDEVLLYMALMGCEGTPAFRRAGNRVATCTVYTVQSAIPELNMVNPNALKNDGDLYEAWLSIGSAIASHAGSVEGQQPESFLRGLCYELFDHKAEFHEESSGLLSTLFCKKIPYLSPTNSAWPVELCRVSGTCVATLERPADIAQIDMRVIDPGQASETTPQATPQATTPQTTTPQATTPQATTLQTTTPQTTTPQADHDQTEDVGYAQETPEEIAAIRDFIQPTSQAAYVRLSGETKNRKAKVSLLSIIQKIPATSELHLLLTRAAAEPRLDTEGPHPPERVHAHPQARGRQVVPGPLVQATPLSPPSRGDSLRG